MPHPVVLAPALARRGFLSHASGLGGIALASLLGRAAAAAPLAGTWPGIVRPLHLPARAKRVIWLYMAGGMTHLDTFDHKPKLAAMDGQPMPESFTKGQQIAQLQGQALRCLAPQHPFARAGASGQEIATIFPEIAARIADRIAIVRSLHTEAINHDPAHTFMNTGSMISGRPSAGSWLWYGLGSDAADLPGFVVMVSTGRFGQSQPIASRQWHSGLLPSRFQGVEFRSKGDPVLYVGRPAGVTPDRQRDVVDAVARLDRLRGDVVDDPEIAARLAQYELAFRMQASVPELVDLADEPASTFELYGTKGGDGSFAANCLLARRLAERGVRFIQLYHRDWDHHGSVRDHVKGTAAEVDRGAAALVEDLARRGMLDETLVVFGTEFGRTPMAQGNGRDHHMKAFSIWLAGGGIKGGITHGATDDLGYGVVENPVTVHDLHATLLHLLGIDHTRLTIPAQGRDFRLTDVHGRVVHELVA
ncbi:MAG: DUF1501 domain-containing protein [Planctomycetes bacterium]|nr:DUF1501 domain-containing protein [Planctomycetota bacterium]MBM4056837.1 DUF1501 domain-containing protein [Planctomycetota bacterium]